MPTLVSLRNSTFVLSSYCLPIGRNLFYVKDVQSWSMCMGNALESSSFGRMQEEEENLCTSLSQWRTHTCPKPNESTNTLQRKWRNRQKLHTQRQMLRALGWGFTTAFAWQLPCKSKFIQSICSSFLCPVFASWGPQDPWLQQQQTFELIREHAGKMKVFLLYST